jgi:hypothetical protein
MGFWSWFALVFTVLGGGGFLACLVHAIVGEVTWRRERNRRRKAREDQHTSEMLLGGIAAMRAGDDDWDDCDDEADPGEDWEPAEPSLPDYREAWPTIPPLRGNPIPMNRVTTVLMPGFDSAEKWQYRQIVDPAEETVVAARVIEPEESETFATFATEAILLEGTSTWAIVPPALPDVRTEEELAYELAFFADPLRSWCAPPEDRAAEEGSPLFWELAENWMDGIKREEFDLWASSSLVPELVASTG